MAMQQSSDDMIALVGEIGKKIATIFPNLQKQGIALPPGMTKQTQHGVKVWRRVVARYERGDFRHESSELTAIGSLGQFLINMHVEIANRARVAKGMLPEPVPQLEIQEHRMVKREISYG